MISNSDMIYEGNFILDEEFLNRIDSLTKYYFNENFIVFNEKYDLPERINKIICLYKQ